MTRKERVNWTIDPYCIKLLKQAQKLNGRHVSLSGFVEKAIRHTYSNKIEQLRDEAKEHFAEAHRIKLVIEELEKIKKEDAKV